MVVTTGHLRRPAVYGKITINTFAAVFFAEQVGIIVLRSFRTSEKCYCGD